MRSYATINIIFVGGCVMQIAIDGPAGAGKSTVAKKLAEELGYIYIDTGAMYRALTLVALQKGLDLNDENALKELANRLSIHFEYHSGEQKIFCNNRDITASIRLPDVNAAVSKVASYPSIRGIMVKQQQQMAENLSVVMDGRDIGECVLPNADYKFYLTAGIEQRALRRAAELAANGVNINFDTILEEIKERDKNDSQRAIGALKILPDAIVIDTSNLSVLQVLDKMLQIIRGE